MSLPTQDGHFGKFGGRFVPEALQAALTELTEAFEEAQADPSFHAELAQRLQVVFADAAVNFYAEHKLAVFAVCV